MIRIEKEYKDALMRIKEYENFFKYHKEKLMKVDGLSETNAEFAIQPARLLYEQIKYEVEQYERIKRGDIEAIQNLEGIGQMLIAVRLALGYSQKEVAERLGVSEAQISKDEKNEYAGVSVQKVQHILQTLGVSSRTEVHLPANPGPGKSTQYHEDIACTG